MNEFPTPLEGGRIIAPILRTIKLKLREVQLLAGGHGGALQAPAHTDFKASHWFSSKDPSARKM